MVLALRKTWKVLPQRSGHCQVVAKIQEGRTVDGPRNKKGHTRKDDLGEDSDSGFWKRTCWHRADDPQIPCSEYLATPPQSTPVNLGPDSLIP